ncbi:alpha/beta hydrolase [Sphingomonas canadensis]|uniref:Alpha/beta hydrolase n=1 Tax=Sphingomonas canadensis TaxID=1219257 RepID=A0ABW3HCQ7_9SPHN|nr:alpha/beta hydrolase-fold protein [Sphingomonas canadensis]MCW3837058.1 alpha/beta hydrolase-fold protein [Sphingomonas canadensis]
MAAALRLLLLALLALLPVPAVAQDEGVPVVIGRSYVLPSKAMGAGRTINVWLPPGYEGGTQRYPVLYLLDGGLAQDFHHISGIAQLGNVAGMTRDMIVVGIESVDRRNELAFAPADPELRTKYPTAGESARFRRFLAGELKPWVAARYRTSGEDALIGESLAGLFVVETLLRQPALFGAYIAISPSLWWDDMALVKAAPPLLAGTGGRRLWLMVADEQGMGVEPFAALLKAQAPAALQWTYKPRPEESHATIYHGAALAAIRELFAVPAQ